MSHELLVGGGVWEQLFVKGIFSFLSTCDLCSASVAFKTFSLSIMTADLWIDLAKRIYSLRYEEVNGGFDATILDYGSAYVHLLRNQSAKEMCIRSELRIARGRTDLTAEMEKSTRCVRHSLDVILLLMSAPLSFLLLFVAVLLFAQHFDSSDIPLWVCAIPLELMFLYLMSVFSLARVFLSKESTNISILYIMWGKEESPPSVKCRTISNAMRTLISMLIAVMCVLEIILVMLKLYSFLGSWNWGVVFTPIYLILAMYPIGFYMCLNWVALFSITVAITLKLNTPGLDFQYWFFYAIMVESGLILLESIVACRFLDLSPELVERAHLRVLLHVCCMVYISLIYVSIDSNVNLSCTASVSPLLIIIAAYFWHTTYKSVRQLYTESQQRSPVQLDLDSAGRDIIFHV